MLRCVLILIVWFWAWPALALAQAEDDLPLPTRADVMAEIEALIAEAYSEDPVRAVIFLIDAAFVLESVPNSRSEFGYLINAAQSVYLNDSIVEDDINSLGDDIARLLHVDGRTLEAEVILEGQLQYAREQWAENVDLEGFYYDLSDISLGYQFLENPLRASALLDEVVALARTRDAEIHYEAVRARLELDIETGNFVAAARRNAVLAGIVSAAAIEDDSSYLARDWPQIAQYVALTEGEDGRRIAMDWARSNYNRRGEFSEFLLRIAEDLPRAVQGTARRDVLNRAALEELSAPDVPDTYSLSRLALLYAEAGECQIAMSLVDLSDTLFEINWATNELSQRRRLVPPLSGGPNQLTLKVLDLRKAQNGEESSDNDIIYIVHGHRPFSYSTSGYLARTRIACTQTYEAVRAILEDREFEPNDSIRVFRSIEQSIENEADRRVFREAVGQQVNVREFLQEAMPDQSRRLASWTRILAYIASLVREAGRGQDANRLTRAAVDALDRVEGSDRIQPLAQILAALPE